LSGQWGRRTAVGVTGLTLCVPIGASAQVPAVEVPQLPQVNVPQVTVPPAVTQPLPVLPQPLPAIPSPPIPVPVPKTPPPTAPGSVLPASSGASPAAAPSPDPGAIVERAAEAVWSPGPGDGTGAETPEERAAARAERREKRARARQVRRRLRKALKRHSECRFLLTGRELRILRLHLGLGDREARSRQAVARRLDTSTGRVRRAERRAVTKLRRARRSGICDSPGMTTMSVSLGGSSPAADLAAALGAAGESGATPDGGVLGARGSGGRGGGSSDDPHGDRRGLQAGGYSLADADGGLTTLAWIALLATIVALAAGILQLWQRGVLGLPDWFRRPGGPRG
jgi:hypothetical protein